MEVLSNAPMLRPSNGREPARCRLRIICEGTDKGLGLRRIDDAGVIMLTLCCAACAAGRVAR